MEKILVTGSHGYIGSVLCPGLMDLGYKVSGLDNGYYIDCYIQKIDNEIPFRRKHGIITAVAQANISENRYKHTLRGFHYQVSPHGEGKTMTILKGGIYDIIVDLRKGSKTYLKWVSLEFSADTRTSFHVPPGCANAFLTLEDNTLIHYYCSHPYTPEAERGMRYNDPLLKFKWPVGKPSHISDKDAGWPDFITD